MSNQTIYTLAKKLGKVLPNDHDGIGRRVSNENSTEKSIYQSPKSESSDEITRRNQKMAMEEAGVIDKWSHQHSNKERGIQILAEDETEKMSATAKSIKSSHTNARKQSSSMRLPHSNSQQRGVDMSSIERPPIPQVFSGQDIVTCWSIPEATETRPGAISIPGPEEKSSQSIALDSHESSREMESRTSRRLISAFLVRDGQDNMENTPGTLTLPLAEATAVADVKPRYRRALLLIGCCLVFGFIGGALAAVLLDAKGEAQFEWSQTGDDILGEAGDNFGRSVSLSHDAKTVAIGARMGGNENLLGQVKVYSIDNGTWAKLGRILTGEDHEDQMGQSVSLSNDGRTVAIGSQSGHLVQIYHYDNTILDWRQRGENIPGEDKEIEKDCYSPSYVSLSGNGLRVAIGAPKHNGEPGIKSGHVRVYGYNDMEKWIQVGKDIYGDEAGDKMGFSTWLNEDGSILAAGAFQQKFPEEIPGYVRVYQFKNNTWNPYGNKIKGNEPGDHFGISVSLSDDASVLAVGADVNDGRGSDAGHVRIFRLNKRNSIWYQIGQSIVGEKNGDNAGFDSVISGDGSVVAVGSRKNDDGGNNSGHVRMFEYIAKDALWNQLGGAIVGKKQNSQLGISLSLDYNGSTVAMGSEGDDYVQIYHLVQN